MTSEEFKDLLFKNGWKSKDVSFHELTIEEAQEKGYLDLYYDIIDKNKQFFMMNENGWVFDTKCNLLKHNLKARKM